MPYLNYRGSFDTTKARRDLRASGLQVPSVREYFETQVYPVLTPLALDPGHPFPHMRNKDLQLIVMLAGERVGEPAFALLQVPPVLPRLVALPDLVSEGATEKVQRFVLLEQLVAQLGAGFNHVHPRADQRGSFA